MEEGRNDKGGTTCGGLTWLWCAAHGCLSAPPSSLTAEAAVLSGPAHPFAALRRPLAECFCVALAR